MSGQEQIKDIEIMKIFGLGTPELVFILLIVIILFGARFAKNLPKIGGAMGKTVKNLKDGLNEGKEEVEADVEDVKPAKKKKVVRVVETVEEVDDNEDVQEELLDETEEDGSLDEVIEEERPKKIKKVVVED